MTPRHAKSLIVLALLAAAGCASVPESDPVVSDARAAVYAARSDSRVVRYAPGELDIATATLNRVDDMIRNYANVEDIHHVADVAREQAALARETARARAAEDAAAAANAERHRIELEARAREADAARQAAREAERQAEASRRQAEAARDQAAAAQRQADVAQQQAISAQQQARDQAQAADLRASALQEQLTDLAAQPSDRGLVVTLNDLLFDPGHAQLQPGGVRAVRKLGDFLRAHPERTIAIEGFADASGTPYFNRQLSERRAQAVQLALIDMGIDPARIVVRGYGDAYPVASNATPVGRQMNRRVEVVISDAQGVVPPRG